MTGTNKKYTLCLIQSNWFPSMASLPLPHAHVDQIISLCVSLFLPSVTTSMYFYNRTNGIDAIEPPPATTTPPSVHLDALESPRKSLEWNRDRETVEIANPESIKNGSDSLNYVHANTEMDPVPVQTVSRNGGEFVAHHFGWQSIIGHL